ncbi:sensor domain-containing diguanylate cyclase [Sulfurimonas marina]|uniref:Sensor domain-containing diguanylate cyclase n=1 Tax=Sulfurimonas marina TaxID=2590551 RepID=A0A7M1AWN4_9BACT|nr:sensor domain-containing diguanylate cyclase [Sulfurimonas marina]QOP41830.1 sensor domain-containing diguanylate cyclase [Sulfurimonas marina]
MEQLTSLLNVVDEKSLYEVFEASFDSVVVTDANWDKGIQILYVNKTFCEATGYTKEEVLGKNPKMFQGPESNYEVLQELKEKLKKGEKFVGQTVNYKKNRAPYYVKWSITPLKNKEQVVVGYVSFQRITDKKGLELKHEKLLSSIVDISNNLILVTDLEGFIVYINNSFSEKLGYKKEELIGRHSRVLKSHEQDKDFYAKMWHSILTKGRFSDVFVSRKKDGSLFYDKKDISTIVDDMGNPIYYVSISQDITEQMEKEKQLQTQAFKDTLTKLYNRRKYNDVIEEKLSAYHHNGDIFSLILIDIDHFKKINDTHGHDVGDAILKDLAKFLKSNIRSDDLIFRWGGEEFVMIVNKPSGSAFLLAEKLRAAISETPLAYMKITASFGVAEITHDMDAQTLFNSADKALYLAKESGRNQVKVHKK